MTPTTIELLKKKPKPPQSSTPSFAKTGWHEELVTQPDGTIAIVWTPLTEADFLHPREGDHLPTNTFHDRMVTMLKDLLSRWFGHQPHTRVFSDLLIKWDLNLGDHSPDIFVTFDLQDPERDRSTFVVAKEGVRPALIFEVVSSRYRRADRKTKVRHYARAKVQEYIILDRRKYRGQIREEVIGYHQVTPGIYEAIVPDDQGRILSQVAGLWISLQNGQLVLENAATGERLLSAWELEQRAEQERQRAEKLAAYLRSQGIDPDTIEI